MDRDGLIPTSLVVRTTLNHVTPVKILAAIERIGWRLEQVDHVWIQTAHDGALDRDRPGLTTPPPL